MATNKTEYLFSVNIHTLPTLIVDPGEEFIVEVRGAFDHIEDIAVVPTPFTPACDGHPLAPIAGPIVVRGAKPGDVVAIDLIELTPFGFDAGRSTKGAGIRRRGPMASQKSGARSSLLLTRRVVSRHGRVVVYRSPC